MPEFAESGHGAILSVELDPVNAPGQLTDVGQLNSDLSMGMNRNEDESTPHNARRWDQWVVSNLINREALAVTINLLKANVSHKKLHQYFLNKTRAGYNLRGPGTDLGDGDEFFGSAELTKYMEVNPVRTGVRSAEITLRWIGEMEIGGTLIPDDSSDVTL